MSTLPLAAFPSEQLIGFLRSPTSGRIVGKGRRWLGIPNFLNRRYDTPAGFDLIGALKQRRVAQHAIVQETFVAGGQRVAEIVFIIKVHVDSADAYRGPRNFCAE